MQADTAVSEQRLKETYPFSDLTRPANVLVFPNLGAANSAYKLLAQLGGAEVIRPRPPGNGTPRADFYSGEAENWMS